MSAWLQEMTERRDRLEAALKVEPGSFIQDSLHGFFLVKKSGLSKKERRDIRRSVPDYNWAQVKAMLLDVY